MEPQKAADASQPVTITIELHFEVRTPEDLHLRMAQIARAMELAGIPPDWGTISGTINGVTLTEKISQTTRNHD